MGVLSYFILFLLFLFVAAFMVTAASLHIPGKAPGSDQPGAPPPLPRLTAWLDSDCKVRMWPGTKEYAINVLHWLRLPHLDETDVDYSNRIAYNKKEQEVL